MQIMGAQSSENYRTHILTRYGSDLNDLSDGLDEETASVWSPFSWYKPEGFIADENNGGVLYYEDWLPSTLLAKPHSRKYKYCYTRRPWS